MNEDKNKLAISIVNDLIDEKIKPLQAALEEVKTLINGNSKLTEEQIKKISDALSTLDKEFREGNKRKPFSLGFLEFDFD